MKKEILFISLIVLVILVTSCTQTSISTAPSSSRPSLGVSNIECPSIDRVMSVCSGNEIPERLQSSPHEDTGGVSCSYMVIIPQEVQEIGVPLGMPTERPVLSIVVNPTEDRFASELSFGFVIAPFIEESEIIGRNEIGIKSLRAKDILGFATDHEVVLITETNDNKTCKPEELLDFGRLVVG